jgi:plastocyanin
MLRKLAYLALPATLFLVPPAPAAPPSPRAAPALAVVEIRADGLHPPDVLIRLGGTVRWVNKDAVTHMLRIVSPVPGRPGAESLPIPPGEILEIGFGASRAYFVEENPGWRGTVTCALDSPEARPRPRP